MVLNSNIGQEQGYLGKYKMEKNGNTSFEPMCRALELVKRIKVIETGTYKLQLQWDDDGVKRSTEVDRQDLAKCKSGFLLSKGLDFYEHSASIVIRYIQQQEQFVGLVLRHQGVGWVTYEGERVFRSNQLITSKQSLLKSEYSGKIAIVPQGSSDIYKQMLDEEVMGHLPSEVALVMGASSVTVGYLQKEINNESLVINFFNDSSTGKSIALLLAVSTSSKPSIQGKTHVTTWLSTQNYIAGSLRDNHGMCFGIDEGSLIKGDISQMIYMLAGGEERGRQGANLKIRDSGNWGTTIMSTSEGSLMELVNQNGGIPNRLFEFGYVTWTKSAQSANKIKRCIQDNYGFLAKDLAEYLANQDYEKVRLEYLQEVEAYENAIGIKNHNEFTHRVAMKMGILLYTAELINRVWDIGIDKQKVLEFIIESLHRQQGEDIADRAYQCILEQATKHYHKFYRKIESKLIKVNEDIIPKGEIWGRICDKSVKVGTRRKVIRQKQQRHREIIFLPHILEELLRRNGFTNVGVIFRKLKAKGLLNAENGKHIRRRIVIPGEGEVFTYVIIDKRVAMPSITLDTELEQGVCSVNDIFNEN